MTNSSPGTPHAIIHSQQVAAGILAYLLTHNRPPATTWTIGKMETGGVLIEGQLDYNGAVAGSYSRLREWATLLDKPSVEVTPYIGGHSGSIDVVGTFHGIPVRVWDGLLTESALTEAQALVDASRTGADA